MTKKTNERSPDNIYITILEDQISVLTVKLQEKQSELELYKEGSIPFERDGIDIIADYLRRLEQRVDTISLLKQVRLLKQTNLLITSMIVEIKDTLNPNGYWNHGDVMGLLEKILSAAQQGVQPTGGTAAKKDDPEK